MTDTENSKLVAAKTGFYRVWKIIGVLVLCAVALYLMSIVRIAMAILLLTVIIVFCLRGIVNGLAKRGLGRGWGTLIAYLIMFAVLTGIGLLMFSPKFGFGGQLTDLAAGVPSYVNSVIDWVQDKYREYAYLLENDTISAWLSAAGSALSSWASGFATKSAQSVVALGGKLLDAVIVICFALVIAFWVLTGLPQLGRETKRLIGPKYAEDAELWHTTFTRVAGGYIKAALLQCLLVGVGSGVVCAIFGMKNAAAWGLIVGIMTIVPVIGPWAGGFLAGIAGMFVAPWVGLAVFLGVVVVERLVLTLLGPIIMGDTVDIHPVLVLVVLSMGSAIGGALSGLGGSVVGMLICVPLAAAIKALFVYYFEKRTRRQIVAEDGFFFKGTPTDTENFDPAADASATAPSGVDITVKLPLPLKGRRSGYADDLGEDMGEEEPDDVTAALNTLSEEPTAVRPVDYIK